MKGHLVVFLCFCACIINANESAEPRGIQLRLTQKGLDYTINEAVKILQEDISKQKLNDFSGSSSGFKYNGKNLKLKKFNIGSSSLHPDYKKGLTASVSDISLSLSGQFKYEKRAWFIKIRDTVDIDAEANGVRFSLSVNFGRSPTGHPTVAVNWCNANVNHLNLRFSGSKASWLYNLFDSIIERSLKGQLADLMCKAARDSINKRTSEEMAEFEIRKGIDKWAILDYSLSAPPNFDHQFMDVFIRGEFTEKKNPHHSSLKVPSFEASSFNNKMLYFWLTSYTLNSAGEVYHNAGALKYNITQKSKVPWMIKNYLNTHGLGVLIPELSRRFPKLPIQIHFHSYKPPSVSIEKGAIELYVFAAANFQVILKGGKLVDVFTMNMDAVAKISPLMTAKNLKGEVTDFKFKMKIVQSEIGPINLPQRLPLIQSLAQAAILNSAKVALDKGLPLPNLNEVHLTNADIQILPNVIRIATDCAYVRKK